MDEFAALRQRLVDNQIRPSDVTDHALISAFLSVPRELFVSPGERPFAYSDRELPYAEAPGRMMMAPVQLARLMAMLPLRAGSRVMAVGCGTGYSAALLGRLAGSVVAVEENATLAETAIERLAKQGAANVTVERTSLTSGFLAGAPYDAILIEGAVELVPSTLIAQLEPAGALAVILREEGISRAMLYGRVDNYAARWPQFEGWATLLPGFEMKREFVF